MEKVKYIKAGQAPKRRAGRHPRLNVRAAAWYALLTLAGVLLYKAGAAYALRERGYAAVGGEALALLLPALYYLASAVIRNAAAERRKPKDGAVSDKNPKT